MVKEWNRQLRHNSVQLTIPTAHTVRAFFDISGPWNTFPEHLYLPPKKMGQPPPIQVNPG